jgi:hypothetical protein
MEKAQRYVPVNIAYFGLTIFFQWDLAFVNIPKQKL